MLQFIDITKSIMYEDVNLQNEFLTVTNATVSHELRNPLQAIITQNLKIKLCISEMQIIIELIKNKEVESIK